MNKTIIFDIGNVLLDWDADRLFSQMVDGPKGLEEFYKKSDFWNINIEGDKSSWDNLLPEFERQNYPYIEFLRAYKERFLVTTNGLIEGSVDIANTLKKEGIPLYALTNFAADTFDTTRTNWPWFDQTFIDILVSGHEGMIKPDPKIYHLALTRWNLEAENTVFIDDSVKNVESAASVGITALHFEGPQKLAEELQALGLPV